MDPPWPRNVLETYPADCQPLRGMRLATTGLSGAVLWKLETLRGPLLLRRYPTAVDLNRLVTIQIFVGQAAAQGLSHLPMSLLNRARLSYVLEHGHFHALSPWLAGQSLADDAWNAAQRTAAATFAGRLHRATAPLTTGSALRGTARGLVRRAEFAARLASGDADRLVSAALTSDRARDWLELGPDLVDLPALWRVTWPMLLPQLEAATQLVVPLQFCVRDLRGEHFLFTGDELTGLVDFDAVGLDTIAADLARWLSDVAPPGSEKRAHALQAYEQERPLSDDERQVLAAYEASAIVLTPFQWLEWLFVEGRTFSAPRLVASRIRLQIQRLRAWLPSA